MKCQCLKKVTETSSLEEVEMLEREPGQGRYKVKSMYEVGVDYVCCLKKVTLYHTADGTHAAKYGLYYS